ncbi:sensor domain-containing diguanylate cyclase [Nitrincola schmidtii]|uniref:GGDEF domain-containing protein n=1 Tax=Nitrincola schmidtii TaxID=1730894 RepID=UPI00124DFAD9|nr:sensor domain-containing diguanylate cyclase [Nitrincola schmidtii]
MIERNGSESSSNKVSRLRSLTTKQALATLLAGLILSLIAGSIELIFDARKMRDEVQSQTLQMLKLVEATAAEAAFQLNPELAEQVVTGLYSSDTVSKVTLRDDFGRVMFSLGTDDQLDNAFYHYLFGNILSYRQILEYRVLANASGRIVGDLELTLSLQSLGQAFSERSLLIFVLSLLKTLGIVLLMVWVFAFLITRPLLRVYTALQTINLEEPGRWKRPYLKYNKGDELEHLVKGLDNLLNAFQKGLDQRDQLHTLSSIDALTGLANRRHFDARINQLWQEARKDKKPLALLFMDIDFFKPFNDNYGHAAGDECLQQVAKLLLTTVTRPDDLVARYGGEEFVCVLPDTDLQGAYQLACRLQENIKKLNLPHAYSQCSERITFSIGIAAEIPMDNEIAPDRLLLLADERLYMAKSAGRNQIILKENAVEAESV